MIYKNFIDKQISQLGFGAMRLPLENGNINIKETEEMVDYAINNGVNYFDTAYSYLNGFSEIVMGDILNKYPRDKWNLATKYPGHQIAETYYPNEIFEDQLRKCKVDYFDYYLLHNVYENCIDVYKDPKWNIIDYFIKQKELDKIKHLGFSSHAHIDLFKKFLDEYGNIMEFCQIQLNYLDYSMQNAKEKYTLLAERNIPCIVMEPVRGGKLATIDENIFKKLKEVEPNWSPAEWAFRFLMNMPNNTVILSGMSNLEQMKENIEIFNNEKTFDHKKKELLLKLAEKMKKGLPCTSCSYCRQNCPAKLNIPMLLNIYNDLLFAQTFTVSMAIEALAENELPSACIKCGNCKQQCPQFIDIPQALEDFTNIIPTLTKWSDVCKQRELEAKKMKKK